LTKLSSELISLSGELTAIDQYRKVTIFASKHSNESKNVDIAKMWGE
jgi:hypothetical protein